MAKKTPEPAQDRSEAAALFDKAVPVVEQTPTAGETSRRAGSSTMAEAVVPARSEAAWTPYVMGLLGPDEQVDGKPRVGGLERLATLLNGEIVRDESRVVYSHYSRGWSSAVCEHAVGFADGRIFTGVADCSPDNTPDGKFNVFPAAMASTRAKGRALRASLNLRNVVTFEECGKGESIELPAVPAGGKITDAQIQWMDVICRRNDINVRTYLGEWNELKGKTLRDIPYEFFQNDIAVDLTSLQNDQAKIEPAFKGYDPNWRKQ